MHDTAAHRLTRWALRLIVVGYLFFLVIWPVALVAAKTFSNGLAPVINALRQPEVIFAFELTLSAAWWAVVINTIFGVGMSMLLVRYEFPGKRTLNALLDLPLSVSPIVVGLALVLVYGGRNGWFGPSLESAGLQVIFSTPGIIMATTFVALPLMIRELVPVLEEIGIEQEQAAQSLGANGFQRFWRITLPSIKWGVTYGVVLTLAVEEKYLNFDPQGAYATAFLLAMVSVACIVVVGIIRPKNNH
jgi:sulfate/thiosulfate transport system permease protein